MKHLSGKKIKIFCVNGKSVTGLCTGGSDDTVKILEDGKTDEMIVFVRNIFSYVIVGEGCTGGYSGLNVYVCKNEDINCKGRIKLSLNPITINDMGCKVCTAKTVEGTGFKCDFGNLGAMEVLPTNIQKVLFDGMLVEKNKKVIKDE
jgi:hypothetical protein